jgi:hypothetical protein
MFVLDPEVLDPESLPQRICTFVKKSEIQMRNFRTNSSNISVFLFGLFEPLIFVTRKYEIQERTIYFDIIVDPFGLAYKTLSLSHRYAKGCQISINKTFRFGLFEPLVYVTRKYEIQEGTIYFDIIVDPFGLAYKTLSLSHRYAKGCQISINKTFRFGLFEPLVYVTRKYEIQEGTIYFDIIVDPFGLACKTLSLSHRYA